MGTNSAQPFLEVSLRGQLEGDAASPVDSVLGIAKDGTLLTRSVGLLLTGVKAMGSDGLRSSVTDDEHQCSRRINPHEMAHDGRQWLPWSGFRSGGACWSWSTCWSWIRHRIWVVAEVSAGFFTWVAVAR